MKSSQIYGSFFAALLITTPYQSHCSGFSQTIQNVGAAAKKCAETTKTFCSNNAGYFMAAAVMSTPVWIWLYQGYLADSKPTQQILIEAQIVCRNAETSAFMEDFMAIVAPATPARSITESIERGYPGYHFPFLSYTHDLQKILSTVENQLWSVRRRLSKLNENAATHRTQLTELQSSLILVKCRLATLLTLVKEDEHYKNEARHRCYDEHQKEYEKYGFGL